RRHVPAGGFQHGERARLLCRRRLAGSLQAGRAGIAANAGDDLIGDLPSVFERGAEDASTALALIIVAALAVDRVHSRLETNRAAIARRTHGPGDDLGAEPGADDPG